MVNCDSKQSSPDYWIFFAGNELRYGLFFSYRGELTMTFSKKYLAIATLTTCAMAATVIGAGGAHAKTVTVTDVGITGYDYTVGITKPGTNQTEYAYDTAIIFTINGHQVLVECDDLWHNINIGPQNLTFTIAPFSGQSSVPNPSGGSYDQAQVNEMSYLLDTSDLIWTSKIATPGTINVEEDLAALQLASWEVGNPTTTYTPSSSAVADLAQTYIGDAVIADSMGESVTRGTYVGQFLSADGIQAQLFDPVVTPLPEPATWTMLILGFFGTGFMVRSSRSRLRKGAQV